jgi:hypothetical protein
MSWRFFIVIITTRPFASLRTAKGVYPNLVCLPMGTWPSTSFARPGVVGQEFGGVCGLLVHAVMTKDCMWHSTAVEPTGTWASLVRRAGEDQGKDMRAMRVVHDSRQSL